MNADYFLTAIWSGLSIAALVYLIFSRYSKYRLDAFRQDLFELRDSLFDEATSGVIKFDHPAYGMLRSTINGFIRFGHMISFCQMLLFAMITNKEDLNMRNSFSFRWEIATKDLSYEVKQKMEEYLSRTHLIVFRHMILGSPILLITIIIPLLLYYLANVVLEQMKDHLAIPLNKIDSAAYAYGKT